jgi:uncharacterized membrane protein YphA (DoxX/SURF4 family)
MTWTSAISAYIVAMLFLVSGVWKLIDPMAASVRMSQALIPSALSLPAAVALGVSETFAGVLLLAPRLRRWGSWLSCLLLLTFLIYFGLFYGALRGEDCNCFPWVRRVVGPAFFLGDSVMLVLALVAGWWARPPGSKRPALVVLGAVCVFAGVSFGVSAARVTAVRAPLSIDVDGKPFSLHEGRVFLFFFNPECTHCEEAARALGKLAWGQTQVIAVPTQMPEFGTEFIISTGLRGKLTSNADLLRRIFPFTDVPYGVALERGYQRATFTTFDNAATTRTLRRFGFVK